MNSDLRELAKVELVPPIIWPEAVSFRGAPKEHSAPSFQQFAGATDLLSGLVARTGDGGTARLVEWVKHRSPLAVRLVLVLYPACGTRKKNLAQLLQAQTECMHIGADVEFRLAPIAGSASPIGTALQAYRRAGEAATYWLGSIGDLGEGPATASCNAVFAGDAAMRDAWRKWFQSIWESAAPLTARTIEIPELVPAIGNAEGANLWKKYLHVFREVTPAVTISSARETPADRPPVAETENSPNNSWDGGLTEPDSLRLLCEEIYSKGVLVSINKLGRSRPLSMPVAATLLGVQATTKTGAVSRRQSFSLDVFDEEDVKAIEQCRKVADVLECLTFLLAAGTRFMPVAAEPLFVRELERRGQAGMKLLRLRTNSNAAEFVEAKQEQITRDLNKMYSALGKGDHVPADKLEAILSGFRHRLEDALTGGLTPGYSTNPIGAPRSPDDQWAQFAALILDAARRMRKSVCDSRFWWGRNDWAFSFREWCEVMDIFGDTILADRDRVRARKELAELENIQNGRADAKEKCLAILKLIRTRNQPVSPNTPASGDGLF